MEINLKLTYPIEHIEYLASINMYQGDDLEVFVKEFITKLLVEQLSAPFISRTMAEISSQADIAKEQIKNNVLAGIQI